MMSLEKALKKERVFLALTGVTPSEFINLVPTFTQCFDQSRWDRYHADRKRQRQPGGGKVPFAKTTEAKLFYVLWYHKCYPTYDVAGFFYDRDRANVKRGKDNWTPILEAALGKKLVLPKRQIRSVEEFLEIFPEAKEVFIDGTERPIQRPKDRAKQKCNYSGKKKRHTRKNLIVSNRKKRIGIVTKTVEGKEHDFSILKTTRLPDHIPKDIRIRVDNGFQGIEKEFPGHRVSMQTKKPKGRELSKTVKERNKAKSRVRVLVEHAIGGMKRFRIVSDVFRNKAEGADDYAILIASGLWNYHLAEAN